jgi:hypothetical protein
MRKDKKRDTHKKNTITYLWEKRKEEKGKEKHLSARSEICAIAKEYRSELEKADVLAFNLRTSGMCGRN